MLEIGKRQLLTIVKKVDFGVYLAKEQEADPEEKVLLPRKEVPENVQPGDEIEVFLYRDSKDRMIATVRQPKLSLERLRCFA